MTPYRQPIKPGDSGLDVIAYKRVLRKRGYPGINIVTPTFGDPAVAALRDEQRKHGLTPDGVAGPATHSIIANGFDKYGVWLYTHATLRNPYVNPFRLSTDLSPGRTDMGVDYHGRGTIVALGNAHVVGLGGSGWPGGQYLLYRLTNGPHSGRYVYVAEGIVPLVHGGSLVQAGEAVAHFRSDAYPGAHPGIEIGWGSPTLNLTYAAVTTGYHEGQQTQAGRAFARLLRELGAPTRDDPGPGPTFPYAV